MDKNMIKYISEEAAIKKIKEERTYVGAFSFEEERAWLLGFHQAISFAISDLASLPAADVRPVVHGKWKRVDDYRYPWGCTNCRNTFSERYNFCPNCGADMREEQDGR